MLGGIVIKKEEEISRYDRLTLYFIKHKIIYFLIAPILICFGILIYYMHTGTDLLKSTFSGLNIIVSFLGFIGYFVSILVLDSTNLLKRDFEDKIASANLYHQNLNLIKKIIKRCSELSEEINKKEKDYQKINALTDNLRLLANESEFGRDFNRARSRLIRLIGGKADFSESTDRYLITLFKINGDLKIECKKVQKKFEANSHKYLK